MSQMTTPCPEYSDKHHRQQLNLHLRAALERALSLSSPDKRRAALERIIAEAQAAKSEA